MARWSILAPPVQGRLRETGPFPIPTAWEEGVGSQPWRLPVRTQLPHAPWSRGHSGTEHSNPGEAASRGAARPLICPGSPSVECGEGAACVLREHRHGSPCTDRHTHVHSGRGIPLKCGEPLRRLFTANPSVNTVCKRAIRDANVKSSLAWVPDIANPAPRFRGAVLLRYSWETPRLAELCFNVLDKEWE